MDPARSHRAWLLASLTPFFALGIFRPWVREAFPVWDYPDVITILRRHPGVLEGANAIAVWNRPTGRQNYLSYLHFSATFGVAGNDSIGWQLARALVMLAAAVLIIVVARRFGATPLAAAIAAGVWAVAAPSTEGWLLLAGEQMGTVFLLLTVLAAAGYRTAPAWRMRGGLIALLCACVMLSKEVLALCLPAVVLLAVCWDPATGFRRPALGPRERWLAALLFVVVALEAWSIGSTVQNSMPASYASAFARDGLDLGRAVTLFQAMLLPARFSSADIASTLYPSNLACLVLLFAGLLLAARDRTAKQDAGWWALLLLSFPVIGALVYGLWPRYTSYYGIPFFTGSAGLLALAATRIERQGRVGRLAVAVLGAVTIVFTAMASARTVRHRHATASLASRVTLALARGPRLDTLMLVTPAQGGRRWPVNASELRSYAIFMEVPDSAIPVTQDVSCDDLVRRMQLPLERNAVLNDQNPCGRIPNPTVTWEEDLGYLDWTSLRRVPLTMRVDLIAPSWPAAPGR